MTQLGTQIYTHLIDSDNYILSIISCFVMDAPVD